MAKMILPPIENGTQFEALFKNNDLWETAIQVISAKHNLSGRMVRSTRGSNIVYRVGDTWIKLFTPFLKEELHFERAGLESTKDSLVTVPKILFDGEIDSWPYVVLSHVSGERIGDIWKTASLNQKEFMASQIADITKSLQSLPANEVLKNRFSWNQFISGQFNTAISTQEKRGLKLADIAKLKRFLSRFTHQEFKTESPSYLHSDLTADHFLVDPQTYKITGVIDFADAMVGHPEYDFGAFFCYVFMDCKPAIKSFFKTWGSFTDPERIMMWVILHRFSSLVRYFGEERLAKVESLSTLAQEAFAYE